MKLGVMVESQEGVGWNEWKNIVQWTEELGFESLWRSDHFFSFFGETRTIDSLDTMIAHTYTAAVSSRIRFGPLVLSMTFRHPAILARMAAAIDQLSGGRFILGVGAGWNQTEHEAYGIELPSVKQRMDNLEESIQVIKALFENDSADFDGQIYTLKDAPMNPKPAQRPMPDSTPRLLVRRRLSTHACASDSFFPPAALPDDCMEITEGGNRNL